MIHNPTHSGFFITGTDTHIGKTTVTCQLLTYLHEHGYRTQAIKPVASGCEHTREGLRNDDALMLQAHANVSLPYTSVNPIALPDPISPNFAAERAGTTLSVHTILNAIQSCIAPASSTVDCILIEGAGGWLVPINDKETLADFAVALRLPVIVVVGLRLGCLNHTLLTIAQIQQTGLPLAGWIANCIDPDMAAQADNIDYLTRTLPCPRLAIVPYHPESITLAHRAPALTLEHPLPLSRSDGVLSKSHGLLS